MTTLNGSSIPAPSQAQLDRGYGPASTATDFGSTPANPIESSPFSQSAAHQNGGRFNEDFDASQRGSSIIDDPVQRSNSVLSQGDTLIPSRGGTLKKKASLRKTGSLKRLGSRRSSRAGSVRSLALQPGGEADEAHSAFYSPVPTTGNPTEILATRFQAWRKVLKDLIAYFREIQGSYEHRAKNILKISNVINNTAAPSVFLQSGGIDDAVQVLRTYHKSAIAEANKSKEIESDVILALIGLRNDLNQKIKEIKNLSGDFKNSVDKEMDNTRKAVNGLQDSLGQADVDPAQMTGKQDPYLLKLAVDRQVEKQIDEENYLHQAYLNLEASGRELESIVVGEIQKSYNAYAGILRREADGAYNTVEELRTGPIAMPKDHEWNEFVQNDEHFIDPRLPVRSAQSIHYPGRDNYLAQAVREGLMERKSKYLKSYTPGWYVLTPTHLHEFKSADKAQAPIMSLYLPEQKLGSQSSAGASSNKFMLKGRQTGTMHRGHSWVFRCESFETMLAWVSDLKTLTEKSPQERNAFVRQHARSVSGSSQRAASISSDGGMDEEDEEPFSATASSVVASGPKQDALPRRPQAGGRFPSDLQVNTQRGLQAPLSPSSGSSSLGDVQDHNVAAASALPGSGVGAHYSPTTTYGEDLTSPTHAAQVNQYALEDRVNPYTARPLSSHNVHANPGSSVLPEVVGTGLGGAALGAAGTEVYHQHESNEAKEAAYNRQQKERAAVEASTVAAPDTFEQKFEQKAAREAALYAAPDAHLAPIPSDEQIMSGGRSETDLTTTKLNSDAYPERATVGLQTQDVPNPLETVFRPLVDETVRPTLAAGQNHPSVQSISTLHVPGEFPKGNKA
ncbi:Phosphatidylinositol 4,5-bisphosphate-binding protein [Lachnellula willkommii]|uniref:Phosphatidylinositol 4,5-bisphosphate-binding protein n=1 Tax=Lachnellula willkommii TaxID=215461 RepID=A0A559ME23_9HELO|nr:Phosphatidylinositol 4,5-bisphosphate-binding protein [Lachnellula willkommii]